MNMDSLSDNHNSNQKLNKKTSIKSSKDSLPIGEIYEFLPSIQKLNNENLDTLKKIHAILLNCINLSKDQKLEFAESERYFMKLYLKKLQDKIQHSE